MPQESTEMILYAIDVEARGSEKTGETGLPDNVQPDGKGALYDVEL